MERLLRRIGHINNESGATSVLVIFMMIVLVTFGAFSITSAHVNIKFAHSATDWTKQYYAMDGKAQEFLYDLDMILCQAAYEAEGDEDAFWVRLDALRGGTFAENYPSAVMSGDFDDDLNYNQYMTYTTDAESYHITIQAIVNEPGVSPRYIVTEWREWQNSSSYEAPGGGVWQPDYDSMFDLDSGGIDVGGGGGGFDINSLDGLDEGN